MPDIKEKLVELLVDFNLDTNNHICDGCGTRPASESCIEIADHLIANGVTIQKWISVEERLPEESGRYLVCVKGYSSLYMKIANFTPCYAGFEEHLKGRRIWFFYDSEYGDCELSRVTHWMPLPEPPKGE